MFKAIRLSIIVGVTLLFAIQPTLHAAYSKSTYNSLLKEIYKKSEQGDAGDIFVLIKNQLGTNYQDNLNLVDKLISELKDNIDKLAFDVVKKDLDRVKKRLVKRIKQRQAAQFVSSGSGGTIAPPTTRVGGG